MTVRTPVRASLAPPGWGSLSRATRWITAPGAGDPPRRRVSVDDAPATRPSARGCGPAHHVSVHEPVARGLHLAIHLGVHPAIDPGIHGRDVHHERVLGLGVLGAGLPHVHPGL